MRQLSIRWRLRLAVGFLALLVVVIGVAALVGMNGAVVGLRGVYGNQLKSTQLIGNAEIEIGRGRAVILRAMVAKDATSAAEDVAKADEYWGASDKAWSAYRALPADDEERKLADAVGEKRNALRATFGTLAARIKAGDTAAYYDVASAIGKANTAMVKTSEALKTLQTTMGKAQYDDAESTYTWMARAVIGLIGFALVAAVLTAWLLVRAIELPLNVALSHFNEMADGDLRTPVPVLSNDEMGRLLAALRDMKARLGATVAAVRSGGESIASTAGQISAGNEDLSSRTEQQAASLEETAASIEELTGTVRQNADNARQAASLAVTARESSREGSAVVTRVMDTMAEIENSATRVSEIIAIIEGIAFQTNILALNAAVEAARAGEQGRGFAVVAGEVRALAQRSSTAAKDIKTLIEESVSRARTGNALVVDAGARMDDIASSVTRVTDIMAEIATASTEQSTGIDQVSTTVSQMDEVTQRNAALVAESTNATRALSEQADALRAAVAVFRLPPQAAVHALAH